MKTYEVFDVESPEILPEDYFTSVHNEENLFAKLCLSSFYNSPKDVELEELFYNSFGVEVDESDRRFLEQQNVEMDYDVIKLSKSEMNNIIKKWRENLI